MNCTPQRNTPQIPKIRFMLREGVYALYLSIGSGWVVKAESTPASELRYPPGFLSQTGNPAITQAMETDSSDRGCKISSERKQGEELPRQPKLPLVLSAYGFLRVWRPSETSGLNLHSCLDERQVSLQTLTGVQRGATRQLSTDRGSEFKWHAQLGAHDRWRMAIMDSKSRAPMAL
jgi:hypothetical protein